MNLISGLMFLLAVCFVLIAAAAAHKVRSRVLKNRGTIEDADREASSTFVAAMHIPVALVAFGLGRMSM